MQFWHLNRLSTICSMTIPGGWVGERGGRGMLIYYVNQLLQVRNNKNCLQLVEPFTSIAFAPVAAELHALKRGVTCTVRHVVRSPTSHFITCPMAQLSSSSSSSSSGKKNKKSPQFKSQLWLQQTIFFFFFFIPRSFWWHHFMLSTTKADEGVLTHPRWCTGYHEHSNMHHDLAQQHWSAKGLSNVHRNNRVHWTKVPHRDDANRTSTFPSLCKDMVLQSTPTPLHSTSMRTQAYAWSTIWNWTCQSRKAICHNIEEQSACIQNIKIYSHIKLLDSVSFSHMCTPPPPNHLPPHAWTCTQKHFFHHCAKKQKQKNCI